MLTWHFYQGLKDEWRWYHLDEAGVIVRESDQGFAELRSCMANAERFGFAGTAFRVHMRVLAESRDTLGDPVRSAGWMSPGRPDRRTDEHTG